jgi:hypothetical protein
LKLAHNGISCHQSKTLYASWSFQKYLLLKNECSISLFIVLQRKAIKYLKTRCTSIPYNTLIISALCVLCIFTGRINMD